LDIKPYLPYADSIVQASSGWADEPIERVKVEFEPAAALKVDQASRPALRSMITEVLELDPRPAFQKRRHRPDDPSSQGMEFGFDFLDYDVKWRIERGAFIVTDLVAL